MQFIPNNAMSGAGLPAQASYQMAPDPQLMQQWVNHWIPQRQWVPPQQLLEQYGAAQLARDAMAATLPQAVMQAAVTQAQAQSPPVPAMQVQVPQLYQLQPQQLPFQHYQLLFYGGSYMGRPVL
jgi:hypothetical protein